MASTMTTLSATLAPALAFFQSSQLTSQKSTVYAVEISEEPLKFIEVRAQKDKIENIEIVLATGTSYEIGSGEIDFALLVTVFHEIEDKNSLIDEIERMLKPNGKVAVIEFHNRQTPFGPLVSNRLGKDAVNTIFESHRFVKEAEFDLGDNFYCIVFK